MKRYLLTGIIFVSLIASIFFLPKIVSAGAKWPCSGIPGECEGWCDNICNQNNQCNPVASCKGGWCSCNCSSCDAGNDYGSCGMGGWYNCSENGICYECSDITAWVVGESPPCQSTGAFERRECGTGGGTDSSCGNAAPPGCSGVCGSGTHCGSSGNSSCSCKTNHTCAEFLQPLHWPKIIRTSETTVFIYWDPYSAPERGADTLSISVYPENINPGFGCNGCIFNQENIDPYITGYVNVTGLEPGSLYTMKAVYYPLGLVCGGREKTFLSSCTMTPDPLDLLSADQTGTLTTDLSLTANQKIGITYTSFSPSVATVSNLNAGQLLVNSASSHSTTVTAVSNGSTTVTSLAKHLVVNGDEFRWDQVCNDNAVVNVAPTATPTPTTIPSNPWIKLKNTSYISKNNLDNLIPAAPVAYDVDDTTEPYFIIGAGGVVTPINLGTNPGVKADSPEYKATGVSSTFLMTPSSYLSYIKARKQSVTITGLGEISGPGIYIYEGPDPLDINAPLPGVFNNNIVLLTTGTVNINTNFNPTGSVAIVANQINFAGTVAQGTGIFIADDITTGVNLNQGLKVVGNLVAQTSLTNDRKWADPDKPSLFIKFDPTQYINLLPYLSTANYDWRQIQ